MSENSPYRYTPLPIDTSAVELSPDVLALTERLAEHAHDIWARQRIKDGWTYGPVRNDALKQHPCLIPYAELPDSERQYDRNAAIDTLKAIIALGFGVSRNA
jgi:ryanodine receptor 2